MDIDSNADIEPLMNAVGRHALYGERNEYLRADADDVTRNAAETIRIGTLDMVSALLQMRGYLEDMDVVSIMINRYPWYKTKITRSKHLELCWFLFLNLCYGFREKVKHFYNHQLIPCNHLGIAPPNWLREELSSVDKTMSGPIRDRGNTTHSWNVRNSKINVFAIVEFLASRGHSDYGSHVSGRHADAKYELKSEITRVCTSAQSCYLRILNDHKPTPIHIVDEFNNIIDRVNGREITLSMRNG